MISAFDSRRMVRHARTSRQPHRCSQLPSEPGKWFPQDCLYPLPFSIHLGWPRTVDNRKIRCGLRHAPDCDLLAVTSITLSHSARTAHPFGLPFTCSIAGPSGSPQRPFPAWLQLATGLRQWLRQADCESNFSFVLAHNRARSTAVPISSACRSFQSLRCFAAVFLRDRHFLRSRFQP